MVSDLSIFAGRIREFIVTCADQFAAPPGIHPGFWKPADAEFNELALRLFALQFQHNAAYRKLCANRKILPANLVHWEKIPGVPASAFKEFELTSLAPAERTHVFHSSGTTEQRPSRHFHSDESLALYQASAKAWFCFHLPGAKQLAILTPPPVQVPGSSLAHMFEMVREEFCAPEKSFLGQLAADHSWTLDFEATVGLLKSSCQKNESVLLLGTAFSFVHLLDYLAEKNLRFKLPPGSGALETGGYKNRSRALSKKDLHQLMTDRLGIQESSIICEYGMSELSSQAYAGGMQNSGRPTDNPRQNFLFPPWARAQIISPETDREVADGETGLLRIYDLANVFSVMAIQTEDLAVRRGDGFELIGRAESAEPRGCSLMSHDLKL